MKINIYNKKKKSLMLLLLVLVACSVLFNCRGQKEAVKPAEASGITSVDTNLVKSKEEKSSDIATTSSMFAEKESLSYYDTDSIYHAITKLDSIPPILKKVFPDVEFYFDYAMLSSSENQLKCQYKDSNLDPYFDFNQLIKLMQYNERIETEDMMLAFVTLKCLYCSIQIVDISECAERLKQNLPAFNLKVTVNINQIEKIYYFFEFQERLIAVASKVNGRYFFKQLDSLPQNFQEL